MIPLAARRLQRPVGGDAAVEAGRQPHPGLLQRPREMAEIAGIDPDIAVGNHHQLVTDQSRHVHEVGDLAVGAMLRGIDDQLEIGLRQIGHQAPDHGHRRVANVTNAEDDLHRPEIILAAEGEEIVVKPGLRAMQRLQHRDAGESAGPRQRPGGEAAQKQDRHDRIEAAGGRQNQKGRSHPVEKNGSHMRHRASPSIVAAPNFVVSVSIVVSASIFTSVSVVVSASIFALIGINSCR